MRDSLNFLSGKRKYLYGLMLLFFISVISVAFSMEGSDDFDIARREVLLRRIGHELLLQSGDSTSRVLPVKKIAENEYRISFEKDLTFQPDSLVNTTQRVLAKDPLARDYVVNVLKSDNVGATYGFAISGNRKDDIVACYGRKQPAARYMIDIKFKSAGINTARNRYLLGSLPVLAFVGFIFLRSVKPRRAFPQNRHTGMFTVGSMLFDAGNRKLMMNGKAIDLTGTEPVYCIFSRCLLTRP